MHIPPGERRRQPDSPRRPLGGSAHRPGRALPPPVTPAPRPRSAPLRAAPRRAAPRGRGQRRHRQRRQPTGNHPPAEPGMEYTKTQRKSGRWTVLGAKCWKFRNYSVAAASRTQSHAGEWPATSGREKRESTKTKLTRAASSSSSFPGSLFAHLLKT
ncbi:proline-rich protein 2-like [Myiozetetes cayanensis]|uniref:proline-rich protein 2-like n=1 Tax=Myiozetetes cayanensis TaxID=478635 RepID=UPI00215E74B7|nr:proline-rich protein 2-like [Myiozetetes cayanensis]